jgi:hypothetical protein
VREALTPAIPYPTREAGSGLQVVLALCPALQHCCLQEAENGEGAHAPERNTELVVEGKGRFQVFLGIGDVLSKDGEASQPQPRPRFGQAVAALSGRCHDWPE